MLWRVGMVWALPDGMSGHAQAGFETSTLHIQAHLYLVDDLHALGWSGPPHVEEGQHAFLGPAENTHRVSPDRLLVPLLDPHVESWIPGWITAGAVDCC